jgi:glycosyltransferase involved in cell wall biosynthesis
VVALLGTGMKLPKIIFFHTYPVGQLSSFVQYDLNFLREQYEVEEFSLASFTNHFRGPLGSRAVWQAVARNDVVFAWFGSCSPVFIVAEALRKPSVLVGGGSDIVSLPEIGYGQSTTHKLWRFLMTLGFRLASQVLLFSDSSRRVALQVPGICPAKLRTLYLGVDGTHFKPDGAKQDMALTVSYITAMNMQRKGLRTFIDAARITPNISYHLAGKPVNEVVVKDILRDGPPNLTYMGYLDEKHLLNEYQRSKVYAQLSMHEGFGMALAEAMSCECIPVVTDCGAIPEVVGDTGIYVHIGDVQGASDAIRKAISATNSNAGKHARQRVLDMFSVAQRKAGLRSIIEMVMSK